MYGLVFEKYFSTDNVKYCRENRYSQVECIYVDYCWFKIKPHFKAYYIEKNIR